jgi:saccharopine dehydrogenase-like NADP-dependent oxidoreductase
MDSENKKLYMGIAIGSASALVLGYLFSRYSLRGAAHANALQKEEHHKILVCGSGMMVPGLVSYLMRKKENEITIASNILEDARKIASHYPKRCNSCLLDVNDLEATTELVKQHDIVISYIPPFLHTKIFDACLEAGVNCVTASYISEEMLNYNDQVVKKGLIFLNECGLDPGIDIMSTMKVKDEVEKEGGKIIKYESWCGGLPSAEDADNPLSYKFSWDPKAVFKTSKNSAKFLKDGEVVHLEPDELLEAGTKVKEYMKSMNLEGYPNRDSLSFREAFGFKDAKTFIRGTLRYGGFGIIMQALHQIGLTDAHIQIDHSKVKSFRDLTEFLAEGFVADLTGLDDVFAKSNITDENDKKLISRLIQKISDKNNLYSIVSSWKFFELLNPNRTISKHMKTPLDVLSVISLEKMSYEEGERDLVIMKHLFEIERRSGKIEHLHSTMMASGDKIGSGGLSIMAKTVG